MMILIHDLFEKKKIFFRALMIVYLHHTGEKDILEHRKSRNLSYNQDDPLHALKALGLNLGIIDHVSVIKTLQINIFFK